MASSDQIGSLNQNSIKIESILSQAAQTLRLEFRNRWKEVTRADWVDSPEDGVKLFAELRGKGFDWQGTAQINCINSGKVENWDISILTTILLNFRKSGRASEEQEHLRKLKQVRNNFAHHSSKAISDQEFKPLWNDAESALVFFGESKAGIRSSTATSLASLLNETVPEMNEPNTKKAIQLKNQAEKCCSEGRLMDAIQLYDDAIMLGGLSDATVAKLYSNRAEAYFMQAETLEDEIDQTSVLKKTLSDAKTAVKYNPDCYKGFLYLGHVYKKMGKFEKAMTNYESAFALEPLRSDVQDARDACALSIRLSVNAEYLKVFRDEPATREQQILEFCVQAGLRIKISSLSAGSVPVEIPGYADVQKAHAYRQGVKEGVFQNYELAAQLFSKAAAVGNIEAINSLGQMYMLGHGVKQDMKKAIQLYQEAVSKSEDAYEGARLAIGTAESSLGFCYSEGIGVLKDDSEAVRWYTRASEKRCTNAMRRLGMHYANGRGVSRDVDKAVQYWKLAVTTGKDPLSMHKLAIHYLEVEKDAAEARKWYKRSIQNGNYTAKLHETAFENGARKVEAAQVPIIKKLQSWEHENKLECTGMTYRQRATRFMNQKDNPDAEMFKVMDTLYSIDLREKKTTTESAYTAAKKFDPDMLKQYSASGSITAKRILEALDNYEYVKMIRLSGGEESHGKLLHHLAQVYKLEEMLVGISGKSKLDLNEIIKNCMERAKSNKDKQLDLDARICYVHLNSESFQHILDFLTPCMKLYPNEVVFHVVAAYLYFRLSRSEEGARMASKSLEKFPNNLDLLYARACHLGKKSNNNQLIIRAFEEYLTHAPVDDRNRPHAFFGIGFTYFAMSFHKVNPKKSLPTNIRKAQEYYQKGLEAEKQQLPCFMYSDSNIKKGLENSLKLVECKLKTSEVGGSHTAPLAEDGQTQIVDVNVKPAPDFALLTDLNRVETIISVRNMTRTIDDQRTLPNWTQLSTPKRNRRRSLKSLDGLAKITLNDMDPTTDHVYVNSILHVTSIEAALVVGAAIGVLMQDSNLSVIRATIYHFHTRDPVKIQKALGVGATMNIVNPYLYQEKEGSGFLIWVDDPKCLKLLSPSRENYCRFCGQDGESTCIRCGKAKYCSKECQVNDWEIMKHKLICKK